MVWDILNGVVQTVVDLMHYWMNFLPDSPIFLSSSDIAAVAGIAGYAAWFLPITAMSVTFGLYIVGIGTWVGILLIKQLIEALAP